MKKTILLSIVLSLTLFASEGANVKTHNPKHEDIYSVHDQKKDIRLKQSKELHIKKLEEAAKKDLKNDSSPIVAQKAEEAREVHKLIEKETSDNIPKLKKRISHNSSGSIDFNKKFEEVKELLLKKENNTNSKKKTPKEIVKEEIEKMLLPIPLKSITMGRKVVIFAEYRERSLTDTPSSTISVHGNVSAAPQTNSAPNADLRNQINVATNQGNPLTRTRPGQINQPQQGEALLGYGPNDIKYDKKIIRLEKGAKFGDWYVYKMKPDVLIYKNSKTDEEIRKYY